MSFNAVQAETGLGAKKVQPYICLVQSPCPCVSACCSDHFKSARVFTSFCFPGAGLLRANCRQRCLGNALLQFPGVSEIMIMHRALACNLKHLPNVETRFSNSQVFLRLDFHHNGCSDLT